jgi:hypothetical protein
MNRISIAATALALALSACAHLDPNSTAELLAANNVYRTNLGLPPLQWSAPLAANAQLWAVHLAETGQLQHSGPGQNLAMAASGTQSLTQLVNLWGSEQTYFTNGAVPNISTTGNWQDAGYYSQLVWRTTTELGCGFAENDGREILVCDYNPPGNVIGKRAY